MFSFVNCLTQKSHKSILIKSKSKKYCLQNDTSPMRLRHLCQVLNKEKQAIKKDTVFHITYKKLGLRLTTIYFIASGGNDSFTPEFHF